MPVVGELLVLGRDEVAVGDVVAEIGGAGFLLRHRTAPGAIFQCLGPGCIYHGTGGSDTSLSNMQTDIKTPLPFVELSHLIFRVPIVVERYNLQGTNDQASSCFPR